MPALYDVDRLSRVLDKLSTSAVGSGDFSKDVGLIIDSVRPWSEKQALLIAYLEAVTASGHDTATDLASGILVGAGVSAGDVIVPSMAISPSGIGWAVSAGSRSETVARLAELATQRVWGGYRGPIDGTLLKDPIKEALDEALDRESMGLDTVDDLLDDIFPTVQKSGVRWARSPSSGACDFCMMLATRGAVYLSRDRAAGKGGYHTHCRCLPVPSTEYRMTSAVRNFDWHKASAS